MFKFLNSALFLAKNGKTVGFIVKALNLLVAAYEKTTAALDPLTRAQEIVRIVTAQFLQEKLNVTTFRIMRFLAVTNWQIGEANAIINKRPGPDFPPTIEQRKE